MVTLSNSMMRAAFSVGAEVFWWSSLVPQSGTTLGELHYIWDLAYNSLSTITNFESFQPLIRLSNMLVIAIAVNGPLLQRAIRVELDTRTSFQEQTLEIRREPMWDLTAKTQGLNGYVFSIVPYQDEFAEAVLEQRQREPIQLPTPACPLDATCMTSVVVAGFTRQCSDSEETTRGLLSLPSASAIIFQTSGSDPSVSAHECSQTGGYSNRTQSKMDSGMCVSLTTYFQLHFENPSHRLMSPSPGELPWKAPDLPPGRAKYTSYVRTKTSVDTVAVRNCNFSTSFIELPIRISNGTTVTMLSAESPIGLSSTNGIESIPHPLNDTGELDYLFTGGFVQALSDMYSGYIVYNSIDPGHMVHGSGPRQFINQSSIVPIRNKGLPSPEPNSAEFHFPSNGYDFSCFDPLNDFVTSLNELSLRYAIKSVSDKGLRATEIGGLMRFFQHNQSYFDSLNLRPKAVPLLGTIISPTQVASMTVSKAIPVYRLFGFTVYCLAAHGMEKAGADRIIVAA
ncbi:unnamed protein product [Clonostachys solani]|uniref:Uncharacterized protein n=1 Tax=Clonostachys solani TaxID=160281 RepID=A0A9P0EG55_9HYPO|nr:unnamed protein product [Clonostachys solani]